MNGNGNEPMPKKSISFSISLPQWMVDLVDDELERNDYDSRSFLILTALKTYFESQIFAEQRGPDFWKRAYRTQISKSCDK